jgi:hypothetical protein
MPTYERGVLDPECETSAGNYRSVFGSRVMDVENVYMSPFVWTILTYSDKVTYHFGMVVSFRIFLAQCTGKRWAVTRICGLGQKILLLDFGSVNDRDWIQRKKRPAIIGRHRDNRR